MTIAIDRLDGLSSSTAVKGPCFVATTANIALTGLQTIDGVAVTAEKRVLVKDQTTQSENGIWVADTGPWRRAKDFNRTTDVVKGTTVFVSGGAAGQRSYALNTDDPVVIGTSAIQFVPIFTLGVSDDPALCTSVHSVNAGVGKYTLTPITPFPVGFPTTLQNGMQFRFVPDVASIYGANQITVTGLTPINRWFLGPSGYAHNSFGDIGKNVPVTVEYRTGLGGNIPDAFVIVGPAQNVISFPHATGKLQTVHPMLSLTQEDGRGILLYNPLSGGWRQLNNPVVSITNVFLPHASMLVEGVPGAVCAPDNLYCVYLHDTGAGPNTAPIFDICRMFLKETAPGANDNATLWPPITNENGIYVKCLNSGGTGVDNTRTFVGLLDTGGTTVITHLSGLVIQVRCASHFKVWRFPFESTQKTYAGVTNTVQAEQAEPRAEWVTMGITDCGYFMFHADVSNNTAGETCYLKLEIDGYGLDGSIFTAESDEFAFTSCLVNASGQISASWGAAIPRGTYRIRPAIRVSGGTGNFKINMTGIIAN